jgi:hypothetical protein
MTSQKPVLAENWTKVATEISRIKVLLQIGRFGRHLTPASDRRAHGNQLFDSAWPICCDPIDTQ